MKIVYFGTPDFAVKPLEKLLESGEKIAAVVTAHDKKVGRKQVLTPSAVKAFALEKGLPVLEYASVRKEGVEDLKALGAVLFITCAFGQILSEEVLALPRLYTLNIHGSLLPKYRGAAPIQAAVLAGEKETGITIMKTALAMDAGDIMFERKLSIGENETSGELFERMSELGAECIVEALSRIKRGRAAFTAQDETKATYVKKIEKTDGEIDFSLSAEEIKNRVRGFEPWPCAYTFLRGEQIKFHRVRVGGGAGAAGEVIDEKNFEIACGTGSVIVEELTKQGGRRMKAADFLHGCKLAKGEKLGC